MKNIPDELEPLGDWELFRSFPDESAALSLAGQLPVSDEELESLALRAGNAEKEGT